MSDMKISYHLEILLDLFYFIINWFISGTVIGAVIMEGFYVVFDRENVQVGFAATTCGGNIIIIYNLLG